MAKIGKWEKSDIRATFNANQRSLPISANIKFNCGTLKSSFILMRSMRLSLAIVGSLTHRAQNNEKTSNQTQLLITRCKVCSSVSLNNSHFGYVLFSHILLEIIINKCHNIWKIRKHLRFCFEISASVAMHS
uniref:Uncharacterized protein n=1 Tax=Glossina pallidipes TaxID=7398 RepID=A0A1A9ZRF8_GLOPL